MFGLVVMGRPGETLPVTPQQRLTSPVETARRLTELRAQLGGSAPAFDARLARLAEGGRP